jgi:5-methylcytosine-specific restriction endonuclease McrA
MTKRRVGEVIRRLKDHGQMKTAPKLPLPVKHRVVSDRTCFYCGIPLFDPKPLQQDGYKQHDDDWTDDHVFPQVSSQFLHNGGMTSWNKTNRVPCCAQCNQYKGRLDPLDWLVIMPSAQGAHRLAERLRELGVQNFEIIASMKRRKPA